MSVVRIAAAAAVVGVIGCAHALAQSATTSVAEINGQLEQEREQGIVCAALLKGYGSPRDQLAGRIEYSAARAAFNATIEGLTAGLMTGDEAGVETTFAEGVEHRETLCDQVMAVLPDMAGTKNPLLALLGSGVVGDVAKLMDAAREFRTSIVAEDQALRNEMMSRLEAKKWPEYDAIAAQR